MHTHAPFVIETCFGMQRFFFVGEGHESIPPILFALDQRGFAADIYTLHNTKGRKVLRYLLCQVSAIIGRIPSSSLPSGRTAKGSGLTDTHAYTCKRQFKRAGDMRGKRA